MSGGNTVRQLMLMEDFGSTALCCTPSYAAFIGETFQEMGIAPEEISLKAGIFGAASSSPWAWQPQSSPRP